MTSGIFTILLHLCLFKHCLIMCADTETSVYLWSVLLDLHRIYCGEIDMCHVTNNNYTEPSPELFPLPCCVPCSCSANCESDQNCCPTRMRLEPKLIISDVTTAPQNERLEITTSADERKHDMMHFLRGSDSWRGENVTMSTQNKIRSDSDTFESIKELGTKTWLDNANVAGKTTTSNATPAEKQPMVGSNDKADNGNTSLEKKDPYNGVQIACLRPQVLHSLNRHPNSDAYEMVISCPEDIKELVTIEKCIAGQSNEDIGDIIPVTSKVTGLTYVNKYCLFCNEHELESKSVVEWQIRILWQRSYYIHTIFLRPQSFMNIVSDHFCNVHFVPTDVTPTRKCKLFDVTKCNETGIWEDYDSTLDDTCNNGVDLPVIHTVNGDRLMFKNIACMLCNSPSSNFNISRLECGYDPDSTPFPRRTLSVTYHSVSGPQVTDEDISVDYIEKTTLHVHSLKSESCSDGSIKLLGRCRRTVCPRDHYGDIGNCIPLYHTLTGLDINFKITVRPEQDVQGTAAREVAEKLKSRMISLMTTILSLQLRDIAVWFMHKAGGRSIRFYLFDIFLYNASNEISFTRAIEELHEFFHVVKVLTRLQISEDKVVGLKYNIGRLMDYSGQSGNLKHLIGKWLEYRDRPENYLPISDANWCVRTEFTDDDIERLGRSVFRIKKTNKILFKDQYDIDHDAVPLCLYACVDYFVDDAVSDDVQDGVIISRDILIPKHVSITPDADRDVMGRVPLPGITVAVVVLVAVIFTMVLVKIKTKIRHGH